MGKTGLRWVLAANPSLMTLDGTRTYLVGRDRPVVIDPGPPLESHLGAVLQILDGVSPLAILLTHAHPDHAGAAEALANSTGAPVWLGMRAPAGTGRLPRVDRLASDGDRLETDAGVLRIVPTPGHSPEHVCVLWTVPGESGPGDLFAGDMFLGSGDTTLVAAPEGNLEDYLRSLDVVEELGPSVIYPAHGEPMADFRNVVGRYRRHRFERIEQVRMALEEDRTWEADALLERVYGRSLDPRLRAAARESIEAILEYLHLQPTSLVERSVKELPGDRR